MAGRRKKEAQAESPETKSYMVEMSVTHNGCTAFVDATSPEEALELFNGMGWNDFTFGEMVNWEVTGKVEENE